MHCVAPSLGPWPTGPDSSSWIIRILNVDPRLSGIFVRLSRELFQLFEPALTFRNILFDSERIRIVLVDMKFFSHLGLQIFLVVWHGVADAL